MKSQHLIQCRLVNEAGFDYVQPDSHPERSRRVLTTSILIYLVLTKRH